jgi:hypothetical protein
MLYLGVLSDTHGHTHNTLAAVDLLDPFPLAAVLHCGDIGSATIPPLLAGWPAHYVLGNVDRDEPELREAIERSGGTLHGRFGELEFDGAKIAFLHGDDERRLRETIASGRWQLVCHGHTHQAARRREGNTLVLNPGALYRARPHSAAVVELPSLDVTMLEF